MLPLTVDDLLPLEEYAGRRREFFDRHIRYVDRYRRVRIGPRLTLIFENRQTLWFRVQEIVRVARLADARCLEQELSIYNRLLPERNRLHAALVIEIADDTQLAKELLPWKHMTGSELTFHLGKRTRTGTLVTCRPDDHALGAAHWVQFTLDSAARLLLADSRQRAYFKFSLADYHQHSPNLSEEIRQSLLDDLTLSDRDAA